MKYTSFNAGFGTNQVSKNITPCDHLYLLHEYFEKPTYATKKIYSTFGENILNTTSFLANTTNYLFACTYAMQDIYNYGIKTMATYDNQPSKYFQAMMTSMFANAIRVKTITDNLNAPQLPT